jgi:hypothetical protein
MYNILKEKTVYPNDPQITSDKLTFHNTCAKCADCNCQITSANFSEVLIASLFINSKALLNLFLTA